MINLLHDLFSKSPMLLIFTIIGLGYFIGHIKIRGFQLNVAAVLFVGIGFGVWDAKAFRLPEELYILGLVLFVYSIGLQSGPAFFQIFRERGFKFNALACLSLLMAIFMTYILGKVLEIPGELLAGLFSGGLTNTPALAAATDSIRELIAKGDIPSELAGAKLGAPTLGYSITYPFGVIGVILSMQFLSRIFKISYDEEREKYFQKISTRQLLIKSFKVSNQTLQGKSYQESKIAEITGMVFTRIKQDEQITLINPETILKAGDILLGIGKPEAIEKALIVVGEEVNLDLTKISPYIEYRDIFVNNKKIVGRHVWELNLDHHFGAIISQVRRGFTNLPIDHSTTLEYGDQIRIVANSNDLERVCSQFGNPIHDLSETDYFSISLGLILGILLGMLPFPLPGGATIRLGFAGGPLIAAIILGWLGRTGPIIWTMPTNANLTIRQLGLYLFLTGIGLKAGGDFLAVFQSEGLKLLAAGAVLTLSTSLFTIIVGRHVFKIDMISLTGLTSGIHTQPACLAFANELTGTDAPNLAYSAVQPFSMLAKIILAQIIVVFF